MRGHRTARALLCVLVGLGGCEPRPSGPASSGESGERDVRAEPVTPRDAEGTAVEHTLRFPAPHTHYLEVESVFPTEGEDELELFMATWTPGSYLVREFARHVERISAATVEGAALPIEKTAKNRWRVRAAGHARIVVRYALYAREASVRTNFVDADIAVVNGAPTFLARVEDLARPHDVRVIPAEGWDDVITGLDPHPSGDAHRFVAPDYDALVDSPIVLGTADVREWQTEGVPHRLATFLGEGVFDTARAARDAERVTAAHAAFWQTMPHGRYVFLNVLTETGGGLEHHDSTLMMASRWDTRRREDYLGWLGLLSHELFHTWNGKRLRPIALGPFDYERENETRDLWVVEGITSYYDDLLVRRAGLMTRAEYLAKLSEAIEEHQAQPGRLVQSLSESSFDAWTVYYRSDENSSNTDVSYYRRGLLVAWLLDAEIRRASGGGRSLDDLMRAAYARFSGERGYTTEDFRALASEIAGTDLTAFFAQNVDAARELDYAPALEWLGLEVPPAAASAARDAGMPAGAEADPPGGYLGVITETRGGRLVVTEVVRDTPGHAAGVNVDDELIAVGEERIAGELTAALARHAPADVVSLLVARRGRLRRLDVTLGARPPTDRWTVSIVESPTSSQRAHLEAWLGADSSPSTGSP